MLTLIGAFLGFMSSALPEIMSFFRERQDRKHELAILSLQMEQQKLGHNQRLEEIDIQADISQSQAAYRFASQPTHTWVDALRASVRPVITYAFFLLFAFVKIYSLQVLLNNGLPFDVAVIRLWDSETQGLFAAVISFWFGARSIAKLRGRGV
jgi:hypothetical protein